MSDEYRDVTVDGNTVVIATGRLDLQRPGAIEVYEVGACLGMYEYEVTTEKDGVQFTDVFVTHFEYDDAAVDALAQSAARRRGGKVVSVRELGEASG